MELINVAFGYVMKWCNDLVGNRYILALLLFALIFEILLLPFGIKQQKNSRKQAALRPKELAIRKKYNGRTDNASKQKMSMEIQEMYQQNGYNPMGGCLPMLIQFPIIIALLNIVYNPLRYICGLSEEAITAVIAKVNSFPEYADVVFNSKRNIDLMAAVKKIGPEAFSGIEGFSDKISSVADIPDLTMFGGKIDLAGVPSFTTPSWLLLIPVLVLLYFVNPLYYLLVACIFGTHLGGCSGDLYVLYLLTVKFKDPKTLMRDTGPEQFFYVPDGENTDAFGN